MIVTSGVGPNGAVSTLTRVSREFRTDLL